MRTAEDRFWSKVNKRSNDECWLWRGGTSIQGYGRFWLDGSMVQAHRFSWEIANGKIPDGDGPHGTCVCHTCDVPGCVNPRHMFLGSNAENLHDMKIKGRADNREGSRNPGATLDENCVVAMRELYRNGWRACDLCQLFGVTSGAVSNIIHRKSWRHVQ